jgi:hypothetical protein
MTFDGGNFHYGWLKGHYLLNEYYFVISFFKGYSLDEVSLMHVFFHHHYHYLSLSQNGVEEGHMHKMFFFLTPSTVLPLLAYMRGENQCVFIIISSLCIRLSGFKVLLKEARNQAL